MPTNRNNNEAKELAIGTRIKYNGKLYEVIESVNCADCSIANICSNSNIDDKIDGGLSVDKRLNIFGVCSSFDRYDSKSVVFVEVPMNKSDNNTINYNIIQPLVEANDTVKDLQIKVPTNFKIDVEASDLDKGIIRFKKKWLSIEEVYDTLFDRKEVTYRQILKDFSNIKMLAIANLMDIASYFNRNWKYRTRGDNDGYIIAYNKTRTEEDGYQVVHINSDTDMYFGNIMFKNEADAQYVIDNPNFRSILDVIFKI